MIINTIKEGHVDFQVAELLSMTGFNIDTKPGWLKMGNGELIWNDRLYTYDVQQPTHALVIEWIEVNFKIYVESFVDDDSTFGYCISKFSEEGRHQYPLKRGFNNRRDAINSALLYTLTNII